MKNMTLSAIAKACNGQLYGDFEPLKEASGVVVDSRKVEKDFLFIATVGERVDGHSFIPEVMEKGALAVVCEKEPANPTGPYILVKNSFDALKSIAKWYRMQLCIKFIGITGSVGKTSTKEFISSVLSEKYKVLKTEGNFNNEIGLPLTILKIQEEHEVAVLEMGISEFGEMHRLSEIAKPDICVITNIGQCHLENLGSRQGILKAKSEIFDFMNKDGSVCLNGDDDMLSTISEVYGKTPIRFGISSDHDIYASNVITHGLNGSTCDIHIYDTTISAVIPLPGEHMVLNALAAAAVGTLLDMTGDEISKGITTVKPVGGRTNIIRQDNLTIIDDCYNANPVSMKAAIDLLHMADTRRVAILGDMFELGSTEHDLHKEVGEYAVTKIDVLVCVGNLSSHMYDGAVEINNKNQSDTISSEAYAELLYYETRDALLAHLSSIVNDNDTVLIKASHGMGFDNVVNALKK